MSAASIVAAWLELQLGLALVAAGALAADRLGLRPRQWVRTVRIWVVLAVAVVALPGLAPSSYEPPASMVGARPALERTAARAVRSMQSMRAARATAPHRTTPSPAALLGLVAGLAIAGSGLRLGVDAARLARRLRGTALVRRIGRVEIRIADRGPSCAVAWGRRAVVVLDRATWRDPHARAITLRHELCHHRHRDPQWAWAWAALRAVALPLPPLAWLHRRTTALEEIATDEAVVATVPAAAYAEVLLAAARRPQRSLPLAVPADAQHALTERITMLATPRRRGASVRALAAAGLFVQLLVVGTAPAHPGADLDLAVLAEDASRPDFAVPADPAVAAMLDRYVTDDRARRFFARALDARDDDGGRIDRALRRADMPAALAAIPLVESGFQNLSTTGGASLAPTGPRGAGLWMFIPATARAYGLVVDGVRDDRLDVDLETEAAIALLGDLHARYGDWGLALAAYNQGHKRVDAAIEAEDTRDVWALVASGALNDYAARIMAAAILLDRPDLVR